MLLLGVVLAIVTLLASIGLLTPPAGSSPLQRWWASPGSTVLTICCLPRAFAARQLSVPPGATLSAWSATTLPFACCSTCAFSPSANCFPSPAGLARFRQGELLNRVVADVDTLDHLYLRVISPLVGALVVIVVVTCGLSLLDVTLALTLGGIMLATLLVHAAAVLSRR